jgi:signal transduction histidine kinase
MTALESGAEASNSRDLGFLDDLLATVSHQLRTPLTIVLGMGRLLEKRLAYQSDSELNVAVSEINFAAEWMERSIEQMLLLAQLEMQRAVPEPLLLRAVVEGALDRHQRIHPGAEVDLLVDEPRIVGVGVPSWVVLILTSLLDNAHRYGDGSRPPVVEISRTDHCAEIAVSSPGPCVDDEERERWFEPFYTGTAGPAVPSGAGLGLTLARKLAEEQRGSLEAAPCERFPGTTFTLNLPREIDSRAA